VRAGGRFRMRLRGNFEMRISGNVDAHTHVRQKF
jgi:hypothetical protein